MTSTKPLTASELLARSVLAAWDHRQFSELQAVLTETPFTGPETLPDVERERMYLIQDIGRNLILWGNSKQAESGESRNVALALVLHLAGC